jgi:hypothetical protein
MHIYLFFPDLVQQKKIIEEASKFGTAAQEGKTIDMIRK